MSKRNPEKMINAEMEQLHSIYSDKQALKEYWEKRYLDTYRDLLTDKSEFGRYGIIAEYILRIIRSGHILDAGCGPGILYEMIRKPSIRYTGLDVADHAIMLARNKFPDQQDCFFTVSFEDFQSEIKFDAIVANEILYYVDHNDFFRHCERLLAPHGHLIVSIFDFGKGRKLIPGVIKKIRNPLVTQVYNADKDLKWHVIAGNYIFKNH